MVCLRLIKLVGWDGVGCVLVKQERERDFFWVLFLCFGFRFSFFSFFSFLGIDLNLNFDCIDRLAVRLMRGESIILPFQLSVQAS